MASRRRWRRLLVSLGLGLCVSGPLAGDCGDRLAVQVLGSGGPRADNDRASSGYLVWIDGKARVLIDLGGGTFTRFGSSGARVTDLSVIGLTHLHADHCAELPALLKSSFFEHRHQALPLIGPSAGGRFPSVENWMQALFGRDKGAFGYLSGHLDGSEGDFLVERIEVDANTSVPTERFSDADLALDAMGVPHGPVPALAFRVRVGEQRIVFSGDQNGDEPAFRDFARDADLLVMHMAVSEDAGRISAALHALPSEIGAIAEDARVKRLVLSHLMPRSERSLDHNLNLIKQHYSGPVMVASDLMCIPIPRPNPGSEDGIVDTIEDR